MTSAYPRADGGRNPESSRLFCDLSMFYSPTGGGIRTYHNAKLNWFASQRLHRYLLIDPGPRESIERPAQNITVVSLPGFKARGDYRVAFSYRRLRAIVQRWRPDVLETGDPWFSGPIGLLFKRRNQVRLWPSRSTARSAATPATTPATGAASAFTR